MLQDDNIEHPALKGFSPTWKSIKHVAASVIKSAAWGALIVGAAVAFVPAVAAVIPSGVLSMFSAKAGAGLLTNVVSSFLLPGALVGGGLGAAFGLAKGMSGAGAAVEQEEEDRISKYGRRQVLDERLAALEMQRAQQSIALAQRAQQVGMGPGMFAGRNPGNAGKSIG